MASVFFFGGGGEGIEDAIFNVNTSHHQNISVKKKLTRNRDRSHIRATDQVW